MDDQNNTKKQIMNDAEVLAVVKKRYAKFSDFLNTNHVTLLWRVIFAFVLLGNFIPLVFFSIVMSAIFFPNTVSFYLVFFVGHMLNISFIVFILTMLTLVLFTLIQKPRGKALDVFLRLIYITVIIYFVPVYLFVLHFIYNR